jgi:hypothetical protein
VTLCNPTKGTAQGGTSTCAGLGPDTIEWSPSQVRTNFGQASQDRPPRQIQYGLKIEF